MAITYRVLRETGGVVGESVLALHEREPFERGKRGHGRSFESVRVARDQVVGSCFVGAQGNEAILVVGPVQTCGPKDILG